MSIKKFKPGDKVIVKPDLIPSIEYDGCYCNEMMSKMVGNILTIKSIDRREYRGVYRVRESGWVFVDEMLEPFNISLELKVCCSGDVHEFETEYKSTDISSIVNLYGGS